MRYGPEHLATMAAGRRRAMAAGVRMGRPSTLPRDVVQRICAEHAAGLSLGAIAAGLTRDRVRTGQDGRRWYRSTVAAVLRRAAE
jgi:hypothetical protein